MYFAVVEIETTKKTIRVANLLISINETEEHVEELIASYIPAGFMVSRVKLLDTFDPVWKVYIRQILQPTVLKSSSVEPIVVNRTVEIIRKIEPDVLNRTVEVIRKIEPEVVNRLRN